MPPSGRYGSAVRCLKGGTVPLELLADHPALIRIRRVPSRLPLTRRYEIELAPHGWPESARRQLTNRPNAVLEPLIGMGDAWSFIQEADRQWAAGHQGWAVEFEEEPGI